MSTLDGIQQNKYSEALQQANNQAQQETASTEQQELNYDVFTQSLNQAGVKTTKIHSENGETNFAQYGAALSDEMKAMITNSFDCEQDYVLQQQIAGIYANKNVVDHNTFVSTLRSMGLTVESHREETSYISDFKNRSNAGYKESGHILTYTISDGKGGEIVIVDANGNGSVESEELFMNQILEGISSDFLSGDISAVQLAGGGSGGGHGSSDTDGISATSHVTSGNSKGKISAAQYNSLVDQYIADHKCSLSDAISRVNSKYDLNKGDIKYSGKYNFADTFSDNQTTIAYGQNIENNAKMQEEEKAAITV